MKPTIKNLVKKVNTPDIENKNPADDEGGGDPDDTNPASTDPEDHDRASSDHAAQTSTGSGDGSQTTGSGGSSKIPSKNPKKVKQTGG